MASTITVDVGEAGAPRLKGASGSMIAARRTRPTHRTTPLTPRPWGLEAGGGMFVAAIIGRAARATGIGAADTAVIIAVGGVGNLRVTRVNAMLGSGSKTTNAKMIGTAQ